MPRWIDMTGWVLKEHGYLDSKVTVIGNPHYKNTKYKKIYWDCKCECGKLFDASGQSLRSGNTKSCGCIHRDQIIKRNISQGTKINIGDIFGKLTVIQDLGFRKQKSRNKNWRWSLCQCECGNIVEYPNNSLLTGAVKSCGCLVSEGENIIEKILKDNNINYIKQYSIDELRGVRGQNKLRFDFAIFIDNKLNCLIEFDGRQHFTGPEASWIHSQSFEEIRANDLLKNEYCQNHNIKLKRIPYYEKDKITLENLLNDFFVNENITSC